MKITPLTELIQKTKIADNSNTATKRDPKLWKAVQDFESIFTYHVLKTMRETIQHSGLTEPGPGKDYFMSLFDEHVAQEASRNQSSVLAETLYRQLANEPEIRPQAPQSSAIKPAARAYAHHSVFSRINQYQPIIQEAARRFRIEPPLISAVIAQESSGNPFAVSPKGAKGLMQLIPGTAAEMGVKNAYNPKENIIGGTKYLSLMLKQFDGDVPLALAAYNAGPSAVKKYQGIPPYKETQNYVKRVLGFLKTFVEGK